MSEIESMIRRIVRQELAELMLSGLDRETAPAARTSRPRSEWREGSTLELVKRTALNHPSAEYLVAEDWAKLYAQDHPEERQLNGRQIGPALSKLLEAGFVEKQYIGNRRTGYRLAMNLDMDSKQ